MKTRLKGLQVKIGILLVANLCILGCLFLGEKKEVQTTGKSLHEDVMLAEETKKVALTFDDGPNPVWTPKLLKGLKERNVQATFFVTGENAEAYPEIIKMMYEDGHIVGNHTYNHVQLTAISEADALTELTRTNEVIYKVTGAYPEYVRPPFGEISDRLEDELDMMTVLWNVDPLDWTTESENLVIRKVVENVEENAIILLHDNYESSVNAALEIVDILQKQGYEFVTVEEIIFD